MNDNPQLSNSEATACVLTRCICKKYDVDLDYQLLAQSRIINLNNIELIDVYINQLIKFELYDLLIPYSLEVLEYDRDDMINSTHDRRNGIRTIKKKSSGIFYTPLDVIKRMVNTCIMSMRMNDSIEKSFIDYSCGSGLFLRAILEYVISELSAVDQKQLCTVVKESIFGIDCSDIAVMCSKFTLLNTLSICGLNINEYYNEIIEILDCNIVVHDGTMGIHPNYVGRKFGCVIGNPPYLKKGSGNLYLPFIYNMIKTTNDCSISSLIVPLSITYGQGGEYCKLREAIARDASEWIFENYDRSPDSLFGDDVKTRNTILTRISSGKGNMIRSTGLVRWTSRKRSATLEKTAATEIIPSDYIIHGVPKIGIPGSFDLFVKLSEGKYTLMDLVSDSKTSWCMYVKETTYNWICAYDHSPLAIKNGDSIEAPGFRKYYFKTECELYYSLAILNSKIAYWIWTVVGDGFHTPSSLLKTIAIHPALYGGFKELSDLGRKLSESIVNYPVTIKNAGMIVQSYDPSSCMNNVIQDIDLEICSVIGIPIKFKKEIDHWYSQHKKCERN